MRTYLLGFFKTGHFSPVGSYVAGMPMAQFEGILCNVDRRLQLYAMVKESSYDQRSVTILDSETFLSGFQDYDPKGTGVLRADDIPTALGTAVFISKQRLDPNRKFHMKTSQRTRVYPVNPLGIMNQEVVLNEPRYDPFVERIIRIRSHFDTVQRLSNKPKRKSGIISSFGKPAKGAECARAFHKANEENIMSHRRCGLNDEDLSC